MMLVGCLVLSACLTLPGTAIPRAAVAPPPDAPATQTTPGTTPVLTTGTGTTGPGAATSATTTASTDADSTSAALGDAVVLTGALDEGDYTALAQAVSERVAPHAGGGAYATALVDALGARGLVRVAAHLPAGGWWCHGSGGVWWERYR